MASLAITTPATASTSQGAVLAATSEAVEGEWSPPEDAADTVVDPAWRETQVVEEEADAPPVEADGGQGESDDAPKADTETVPDSGSKDVSVNRAPGGTTVGAPGTGEMPYFTFQDFSLAPDQSARVNIANGNLLLKAVDLALPGPGYALREDRYYNGLSDEEGQYGGGWHSSTNDTTITSTDTGALFRGFNGAELTFTGAGWEPGTGGWFYPEYRAPAGSNMTLDHGESYMSPFRATLNKTGETFKTQVNTGGPMGRIEDRNGVGISRPIRWSGDPQRLVHDSGRSITFHETADGKRFTDITDSAGRDVLYTYEAVGSSTRLKSVTAVDGKVTTYSYDSTGRVSSIVLPSSVNSTTTVSFTYDSAHRVKKVIQEPGIETIFTYSSGQTVVTDANGHNATYTINSDGLVTATKDGLNRTRSQQWTANMDIETTTDAIGSNDTTYTYDGSGNRLSAQLPTGAAASATYAIGSGCGAPDTGTAFQPKCSQDDAGNKKQYEYDAAGNLIKQRDTTTNTAVTEFENTYGTCGGFAGQICTTKDGRGNVTSYTYDAKGNLTNVTPPAPMGPTTYTYDSLGRVKTVTDGRGDVTAYTYDVRDRLLRTTFDNADKLSSTYYPNGLEKTRTDSAGGSISFEYDRQGRLTKQAGPRSGVTQTYSYDEVGNMLAYTDAAGTTSYSYDAANQLTRLTEPGGSCPATGNATDNSGCIKFQYDLNSAEIKRFLPGGATVSTTRDGSGRPTRITGKDDTGAVGVDIGYGYTPTGSTGDRGNVQTRTAFKEEGITAGAVTSYTYNSRNRLSSAIEKTGSTTSASWFYTYDVDGNRTRQVRSGSTGVAAGTMNYTYNAANQLTSATGQSTSWTYDAAGNQTRNGTTGATATYGNRGQVTQLGSTANGYFGTGNTDRISAGATTFNSSALGLADRTSGSATQTYTRTADGEAVAFKAANRWYYAQDHLGSVVGIFSSAGKYTGGYSYSPYGEARSTSTSSAVSTNPLRYIGSYHEGDGIYKLGARYYDSAQGRFTQMDPSGQEKNPYAYAACNPINAKDPSGLSCGSAIADLVWSSLGFALAVGALVGLSVATSGAAALSFAAINAVGVGAIIDLAASIWGAGSAIGGIQEECQ